MSEPTRLHTRQRGILIVLRQGLLTCLLKALAFAPVLAAAASGQLPAQSVPQSVAKSAGKIEITASRGSRTIYVGESIDLDIELRDTRGQPIAAPQDQRMLLTVTTLANLNLAKSKLASERAQPQQALGSLSGKTLMLASGRDAVQMSGIFPRPQKKITLKILPRVAGKIRVFAECPDFIPGNLLIPVLPRSVQLDRSEPSARTVSGPRVIQASWKAQPGSGMYLALEESGLDAFVDEAGDLIATFDVTLNERGLPIAAPQDLTVALKVAKGRAGFNPREVTIRRGKAANAPNETASLRSPTGGDVELQAVVLSPSTLGIKPHQGPYVYLIDKAAKQLLLTPSSPVAMANGLDAITLTVTAVGKDNRVIRAEQEGLNERMVSLRLDKGIGFNFTDNNPKIQIPKDQDSGSITLVARRPITNLTVLAESRNTMGEILKGETVVSYVLPSWQWLCAALGGLTLPLLAVLWKKKTKPRTGPAWQPPLWGAGWGFLLFALVFFGALGVSTLNFQGFPVLVTRLPTENHMAALVLGLIAGGIPLGYSKVKNRGES